MNILYFIITRDKKCCFCTSVHFNIIIIIGIFRYRHLLFRPFIQILNTIYNITRGISFLRFIRSRLFRCSYLLCELFRWHIPHSSQLSLHRWQFTRTNQRHTTLLRVVSKNPCEQNVSCVFIDSVNLNINAVVAVTKRSLSKMKSAELKLSRS